MKRTMIGLAALCVMLAAAAFSQPGAKPPALEIEREKRNPWTNLGFADDQGFQFAVISDRTGGHRPEVFERAVARLNLMQPEFVMSVGDLIEGGKKKREQYEKEWAEFDG
ncbi:MAG: hypothetical protein K2W96_09680, partial [Gemmataceae bacterium]|nr:hypothetical protein [Gemmataceae bacterium]